MLKIILAKLKSLKYKFNNIISKWKEKILETHRSLKGHPADKDIKISPYKIFQNWVLDCFQFGIVVTFIYLTIILWDSPLKWITMPFAFGMSRWVLGDICYTIINEFKGVK